MAKDTNITVRLRDRFSTGMKRIGKSVKNMRQRFLSLRTAVVAAVAAFGAFRGLRLIKDFFVGAINVAKDFESQMATVKAVTGAVGEEFDALTQAAELAGRSTRFTATEAGQGLEELTRAGFSARQAIESLNPTLQTAQANSIEVAEAAQLMTTTLNQFGQEANQAGRVADVLTRTTQRSATNITELGEAFSYAGPLAAQVGLSIEDTAAMLGALADQGFRASRGGTALNRLFIDIQDPASKFRKELDKLGIPADNVNQVLLDLGKRGDQAKDALLALGARGGPAIAALVNNGIPKFRQLRSELQDVEGTTKNAAETMDDNLFGALKNLASAFEGLQIKLVSGLMKDLKEDIFDLAAKLREFTASDAFDKLVSGLAEGFRNSVAAVKDFIKEFDFEEATLKLSEFVSTFGEKTQTIIDHSKAMFKVFSAITTGIKTLFNSLQTGTTFLAGVASKASAKLLEAMDFATAGLFDLQKQIEFLNSAADASFKSTVKNANETRDAMRQFFAVFTGGTEDVERAAEGIEKSAAATKKAGVEAEEATEKVSGLSDTFLELAESIENSGTAEQVEAIKIKLETLRATGEITARDYDAAMKLVEERLGQVGDEAERTSEKIEDEAKGALDSVRDFSFNINQQIQQDAEKTRKEFEKVFADSSATLADKQQAFLAYAEAAVKANNDVISSELRAKAEALGVADALEEVARKGDEVGKRGSDGFRKVADEAKRAKQETKDLGSTTEESVSSFEKAQGGAKGMAAAIGSIIGRYQELGGVVGEVGQEMVTQTARGGNTITGFFRQLGQRLRRVETEFRNNASAFDRWRAQLEAGTIDASRFVQEIRSIGGEAAILDKQRLDFFRAQMAAAQQDVRRLRQEFVALNNEIERDFLSASGAEEELIKRQFDQRKKELESAFEALSFSEQQEQRQQYRESLRRLEELEAKRLAELRERQRAEQQANEELTEDRENKSRDYHRNEKDRIRERNQSSAGSISFFEEQERAAVEHHNNELERIEERKNAEKAAAQEVQQAIAPGFAGAKKSGSQDKLEVVVRTLSDQLNGNRISLDPAQANEIANLVLSRISRMRGTAGVYRG